jgi:hypothetical protein
VEEISNYKLDLANTYIFVHTKFYPISFFQGYVHILMKLLGIISVGLDVTGQLLIRSFCIRQILEKKWKYNVIYS